MGGAIDVFSNVDVNGTAIPPTGLTASIVSANEGSWLHVSVTDRIEVTGLTPPTMGEVSLVDTVRVSADNAANSRDVEVTLLIGAGPVLRLFSQELDTLWFHHVPSAAELPDPDDPTAQIFTKTLAVINSGGGSLVDVDIDFVEYNPLDPVQGWLAAESTEDSLRFTVEYPPIGQCRPIPGGATGSNTFTRLGSRVCSATVQVSSPFAEDPDSVEVYLTFDREPTVFLGAKTINLGRPAEAAGDTSVVVSLSGTGLIAQDALVPSSGGAVFFDGPDELADFIVATPTDPSGAPVDWLTANFVNFEAVLTASSAGLAEGSYRAGIVVTHHPVLTPQSNAPIVNDSIVVATDTDTLRLDLAAVLPDTIMVEFTVTAPLPRISVDPAAVTIGSGAPVVAVHNGGGVSSPTSGPIPWSRAEFWPSWIRVRLSPVPRRD